MNNIGKNEIEKGLSCIILAAGEGTRMKPISLKMPKALCPIVDKPIIERCLEGFFQLGIKRFVIVVRAEENPIREYLLRSSIKVDLKFAYQAEALGSGHALMMAEDIVETDSFFVAACDNIVPFAHLEEMHYKFYREDCDAVLSLQHETLEGIFARSNVSLQRDRVIKIIEKPGKEEIMSDVICLPIYLCRQDIFSYLKRLPLSPRGEYELPQVFQMMIDNGKDIYGIFTDKRFDLTSPADLLEINRAFLKEEVKGIVSRSVLPQDINILPPVFIDSDCCFGQQCSLGPYVVVSKNCSIGARVQLSKCVILEGTEVYAGQKLSERIIFNP